MSRTWLIKSEPDVYSIDHLARDGRTAWEGVRNYQARNFMRADMQVGDLALFYHSNADVIGVAGVARVASAPYPDPTQFIPGHKYEDPASKPTDPRWWLVDFAWDRKLPRVVTLAELKADPELAGMLVVQRGQRLSVQPVDAAHFARVLALAET
jgi:predicted RNA-binding protein with PUA-like domain